MATQLLSSDIGNNATWRRYGGCIIIFMGAAQLSQQEPATSCAY
jgi:hypothetical protein